MKKIYPVALALSFFFLIINSAISQHTFDEKRKSKVAVDVSSLNARKISRPKNSPKSRVSQHAYKNSRALVFPNQANGHRVLLVNDGRPTFIRSDRERQPGAIARRNVNEASFEYLKELSPLLGFRGDVSNDFAIQRIKEDAHNGSHIRMQQLYKGIPVHGAEVVVHLNSFGQGKAFNGRYILPTIDINVVPSFGMDAAIRKVKGDASTASARALTTLEKELVQYGDPEAALCIYEDKGLITSHVLAYRVVYSPSIHKRLEYFIDAHTGNVLKQINTICYVDGPKTATATDLNGVSHTVHTYQIGPNYFMLDGSRPMFNATASVLPDAAVGGIITVDMNNTFGDDAAVLHLSTTNNVWNTGNHAKAVSAHFNAGKAYEYFLANHGRSSINGKGGTMISVINVTDPETGDALDNAFWNGKAMFYGNGKVGLKPLSGALDAAGHEMTHGVIENTANLDYEGESGAINESMADVFGSLMDPEDWTIGEDVVKLSAFPSGALRSLEDPHNGGTALGQPGYQPKHMNEKYLGTSDNGGVHINSGIPNHAFYRYAEAISREKAAAVYYKALDDYLTKSSQFIDLRLAVIAAAEDLFGAASNEVTQAGLAFDAVGITDGDGGDYQDELPQNPGAEYLLVYNTFAGDPNTLYRIAVGNNNTPTPLTTTGFASRPSVTDDGLYAVFVAEDKTIHSIVTAPGEEPEEFVIQDETIWSNVAISKDGNRLAAVTEDADNTVYVYDFDSETWADFELYNPTYSDGINSGGTEFADALEWDYTGQFVVYDAFNRIQNASGNDIEYWDVNFMYVWDFENKDFADGTVMKLFSTLPEGVSIGNPTFAKLSPNVLAFDMVDEINDEYYIVGANIETGETDIIYANETLGFPSFNKTDTRVAFTMDNGGNFYTGYVNLNSDKISSSQEEPTDLFDQTQWAVYFAAGDRGIGDDGDVTGLPEQTTVKLACYPNPFVNEIALELTSDFAGSEKVQILDALGHQLYTGGSSNTAGTIVLGLSSLPAGSYIVRVQQGNKIGMCRAVKGNR